MHIFADQKTGYDNMAHRCKPPGTAHALSLSLSRAVSLSPTHTQTHVHTHPRTPAHTEDQVKAERKSVWKVPTRSMLQISFHPSSSL